MRTCIDPFPPVCCTKHCQNSIQATKIVCPQYCAHTQISFIFPFTAFFADGPDVFRLIFECVHLRHNIYFCLYFFVGIIKSVTATWRSSAFANNTISYGMDFCYENIFFVLLWNCEGLLLFNHVHKLAHWARRVVNETVKWWWCRTSSASNTYTTTGKWNFIKSQLKFLETRTYSNHCSVKRFFVHHLLCSLPRSRCFGSVGEALPLNISAVSNN